MRADAAGSPRSPPRPSGRRPCGPALLCWLRSRWRIENAFTYAAANHGIDTLAGYLTDIGPDQRMVTNPARTAARAAVAAAEAALAAAAHLPGERRPPVCARPAAGLRTKAPCPR